MRKHLLWLAGVLAIGFVAFAWSQQLVPFNYTGNETWVVSVGGPQGQSGFITLSVARNTEGTSTAAGAATVNTSGSILYKNYVATASVSTWNVTLPNPAYDGQVQSFGTGNSGAGVGVLIVNVTGSPQVQTLNSGTWQAPVTSGTSVEFVFNFATLTWFKIR